MSENHFSSKNRLHMLEKMSQSELDLLVIGGGITGTGIALDAVSRGLKVGLVEKADFASGTSSRSGKLIHGGLKYLKQGELGVIRETGTERAVVHKNARHLVKRVNMLFPIVKNGSFNKFTLKIGLATYDRLAGVKNDERHEMLSKKEVFEQEPLLNPELVSGGGMYIEYRTDDSRLTLEVAKTAYEKGALISNYAEVTDFQKDEKGKVMGVMVKDKVSQKSFQIQSKYIVNAGGPWVDKIRLLDGEISGKSLHLAKGIHIVVPFEKLPVNESIYFDAAGRMIAVVPRNGCTYIGSTESSYYHDLDDIYVEKEEVEYLLNCTNTMFPSVHLTEADITSSWAGLRPLISDEGKAPSELSRKDEIFTSESGLITIAGGKLTGYRRMAERVVDFVLRQGNQTFISSQTENIKLTGGKFETDQELDELVNDLDRDFKIEGVTKELITEFVHRYGSNTPGLLEAIQEFQSEHLLHKKSLHEIIAAAELHYTIENEMVVHLSDFLDRRTGYLLFNRNEIPQIIEAVSSTLGSELGWDEGAAKIETSLFDKEYRKAIQFI
ncbi:glycerol-3-phosphate dehydrogenase/oxidase [Neobacillus sp. MM2021_6]|uniref:glycerol-3-phosphate dehydrogenase/oxidase n=1 Tax=Bacillaceae TaxID=186817 RepID=UPI001407ADBA|nr:MULTISPECIES: glycerol-3-phosphate dehydrogenase/oxidase [Bacillaceae]MBO0958668.1 glycerol-3-phosphate dehydrogenase/oxidase [Neobacillus sp. MM2021_6]NHC20192.1 glycerol-3-phosphate dehydrogenase/oxidase [Bacillus sp. MM2020_4]